MINGQGTLSYRKKDLENQKVPAVGFTKLYFAHKATAGQTGINLASLSTPSEMTANGFANPTASQLSAAQLLFFKNNLRLESSLRGLLIQGLSYVVASSTQINFVGFTAADGEIFTGTIDYSAQTGVKVVDATAQPATGSLAATTTDFNIGQSFQTNKYSTAQVGACIVYLNGVQQFRNTGNSSVVLDGNYYEVDNGSGSFSVIRFNVADAVNARSVLVVPNGLLSERPDGSMMAVIENIQGQINNMSTYVADVTGQTQNTVLGAAPSNVDLKSFGDRVVSLEQKLPNGQVISSTGAGHGSTATTVRRFSTNTTIGTAITCSGNDTVNGTTYTINQNGIYAITYVDRQSGAAAYIGITLNSTQLTTAIDSITAANVLAEVFSGASNSRSQVCVAAIRLSAGDVIRPQDNGAMDETTYAKFIITQIART